METTNTQPWCLTVDAQLKGDALRRFNAEAQNFVSSQAWIAKDVSASEEIPEPAGGEACPCCTVFQLSLEHATRANRAWRADIAKVLQFFRSISEGTGSFITVLVRRPTARYCDQETIGYINAPWPNPDHFSEVILNETGAT